jgi:anti-sigma B factor antagonist
MDGFSLTVHRTGARVTVTVTGDLDMATTPDLSAFLATALRDGDDHVSLDLAGLTFIDAQGLGALVSFRNRTRRQGIHLKLINSSNCVKRLLRLTGLDEGFAST